MENKQNQFAELQTANVEDLTGAEINSILKAAFGASAEALSGDERATAIKSLVFAQQNALAASTTSSYNYKGNGSISWRRDYTNSPITTSEASLGVFKIFADHFTKAGLGLLIAARSSKSTLQSIKDAVASVGLTTAITIAANAFSPFAALPLAAQSAAVGLVGSFVWDRISVLERNNLVSYFNSMGDAQLLKVVRTYNNGTDILGDFSRISPSVSGSSFNYTYTVPNPFSGLYGNWTKDNPIFNV